MSFFKRQEQSKKNEIKPETDSLQPDDFWLLLFVSTVTLMLVFKFYS